VSSVSVSVHAVEVSVLLSELLFLTVILRSQAGACWFSETFETDNCFVRSFTESVNSLICCFNASFSFFSFSISSFAWKALERASPAFCEIAFTFGVLGLFVVFSAV